MADAEQGQVQPEVQQEPARRSGSTAEESSTASPPAVREQSAWRWPEEPGKLPSYVRGEFRMKTYALIAIQSICVLLITMLVDYVLTTTQQRQKVSFIQFLFLEAAALISLLALNCFRLRYPVNYATLASFTVMVGISWGLGGDALETHAHFQLLGVLCAAMSIATAMQALMLRCDLKGWWAVAAPLVTGWAAGAVAMILVVLCLDASSDSLFWALVAAGISFAQFLWLILDMCRPLHECNPDDFMKVVISMDSTLLVIVSIPLFIVAACLVHSEVAVEPEEAVETGPNLTVHA